MVLFGGSKNERNGKISSLRSAIAYYLSAKGRHIKFNLFEPPKIVRFYFGSHTFLCNIGKPFLLFHLIDMRYSWRNSDLKHQDGSHADGIPEVYFVPVMRRTWKADCILSSSWRWRRHIHGFDVVLFFDLPVFFLTTHKEVPFCCLLCFFEEKFYDEHPWSRNMR